MLPHRYTSMADSTARLRATRLAGTAGLLLSLAALALWIDMPLARLVKAGSLPGSVADVLRLAEVFSHGLGVLLVVLAATALDPRAWRVAPRLLCGAYLAGLLANVGKLLAIRTRPEHFDLAKSALESFHGWRFLETALPLERTYQSFPSAHTATATGLALALGRLYPQGRWFFVLLAVLCGWQRIEASAHYLSDVLAGAALGFIATLLLDLRPDQKWFAKLEAVGAGDFSGRRE